MKKLIVSALAIASLVACSKDELVNQQGPVAISFKQAYVENVTRATDPSLTTANIEGFDVWGYMDQPSGTTFSDQDVIKSESSEEWIYSPLQYWVPGHTYYFDALAPMNSENWDFDATNGVVSFTNVNGSEDLIYATTSVTTSKDINKQPESVNLAFDHLLSKVKFSFSNGFPADNYTITVKNIKMTAPAAGSIDLTAENGWTLEDGNVDLEFGDMDAEKLAISKTATSAMELLTIPADAEQEYTVTFDVELYVGDVLAFENSMVTYISGTALEMGKAYNFHATLNANNVAGTALTPIKFDVEVNDWANGEGYDGGEIETAIVAEVDNATDFVAAITDGKDVILTKDINLDNLTRAAAEAGVQVYKDVTINGNGFAISTSAKRAIQIIDAQNVTIKNLTINAPKSERGIQLQGNGNLTISNVNVTAANYALNLPASASNAKVTIKDSYFKGLNVINVWGENAVVEIENTTLACEDNNNLESYALVCANGANAKITVNGGEVIITGTNSNGTNAGSINATGAEITFNGTKGDCTVVGHSFAIIYGDYSYTFSTFEGALSKAVDGDIIKLLQDVTVEAPLVVTKNITIDLNGKNITNTKMSAEYGAGEAIIAYNNLTINGNGTVKGATRAVWARGNNDVTVTINGGTYYGAAEGFAEGGCSVIYASSNNTININGGKFEALSADKTSYANKNGVYAALNVQDNAGFINVYGGTFVKFDPAVPGTEPASWIKTHPNGFVAEGYSSVETESGIWTVSKN